MGYSVVGAVETGELKRVHEWFHGEMLFLRPVFGYETVARSVIEQGHNRHLIDFDAVQ